MVSNPWWLRYPWKRIPVRNWTGAVERQKEPVCYCKRTDPCPAGFKQIKRTYQKGTYFIICLYEYGCNQKTFHKVRKRLDDIGL
jgi:hypothetical protein